MSPKYLIVADGSIRGIRGKELHVGLTNQSFVRKKGGVIYVFYGVKTSVYLELQNTNSTEGCAVRKAG